MEKDKFQPIVMPCTKEQYDSLIPILEQNEISIARNKDNCPYSKRITTYFAKYNNFVSRTYIPNAIFETDRPEVKIYKRFNRKIFLKSLGIVEEPEFVLPKKWCVRINNENYNIISEYRSKIHHYPLTVSREGFMHSDGIITKSNPSLNNILSSTEITFEQFQKYVLKQNISILESQSVTNKQTNAMVKATVEELQPKEKIHKGCLVKWKDIIAIVTLTKGNYIEMMSLSKGIGTRYNINIDIDNISLFKGKLTLEQ